MKTGTLAIVIGHLGVSCAEMQARTHLATPVIVVAKISERNEKLNDLEYFLKSNFFTRNVMTISLFGYSAVLSKKEKVKILTNKEVNKVFARKLALPLGTGSVHRPIKYPTGFT